MGWVRVRSPRTVAWNLCFVLRALGSHGRIQSRGGTGSDSSCLLEGGFKGSETRLPDQGGGWGLRNKEEPGSGQGLWDWEARALV